MIGYSDVLQYSQNGNEAEAECLNDGKQHELSYLDVKLRYVS